MGSVEVQAHRQAHKLGWDTKLKSQSRSHTFPPACQMELEHQVARIAMGRSAITSRAEPISNTEIAHTARTISSTYNKLAVRKRRAVFRAAAGIVKRFKAGSITEEAAVVQTMAQKLPKLARTPSVHLGRILGLAYSNHRAVYCAVL